jgi:hypothetical protein
VEEEEAGSMHAQCMLNACSILSTTKKQNIVPNNEDFVTTDLCNKQT